MAEIVTRIGAELFQFQLGTIGRPFCSEISTVSIWFQFQLGTIGRIWGLLKEEGVSSFNSSLVRLGVCESLVFPELFDPFQFQLGTIGRSNLHSGLLELMPFQFQLGTIGSSGHEVQREQTNFVSIPAWYDWETDDPLTFRYCDSVSIPAWYDWELIKPVS